MFLLRLIIIILLPISGISQSTWITKSNTAGKIIFDFLDEPENSIDTLSIGNDVVYKRSWKLKVEEQKHMNIYYEVSISSYPDNYIHSDSSFILIEGFLNSAVNSYIEDERYEQLTSRVDILNGFPGKVNKFKNIESNSLITIHCYLIQDLLIEMVVISKPNEWFSASTSRFLTSLDVNSIKENKINYGFTFIDAITYEIKFPDSHEEMSMFVDSEHGRLNMNLSILERKQKEGNLVFLSGETKFPDDFVLEKNAMDGFYMESIEGSLRSTNATLLEKNFFQYDDVKGIEYSSSLLEGTAKGYHKVLFVRNRLYVIGVISFNMEKDEEIDLFFKSFKLKK